MIVLIKSSVKKFRIGYLNVDNGIINIQKVRQAGKNSLIVVHKAGKQASVAFYYGWNEDCGFHQGLRLKQIL